MKPMKMPHELRHHATTEPTTLLDLMCAQGWHEPQMAHNQYGADTPATRRWRRTAARRDASLRAVLVTGYTLPRPIARQPDPYLYLTVRRALYRFAPDGACERWGQRPGVGWSWGMAAGYVGWRSALSTAIAAATYRAAAAAEPLPFASETNTNMCPIRAVQGTARSDNGQD